MICLLSKPKMTTLGHSGEDNNSFFLNLAFVHVQHYKTVSNILPEKLDNQGVILPILKIFTK